jgi:hypothetical protein
MIDQAMIHGITTELKVEMAEKALDVRPSDQERRVEGAIHGATLHDQSGPLNILNAYMEVPEMERYSNAAERADASAEGDEPRCIIGGGEQRDVAGEDEEEESDLGI